MAVISPKNLDALSQFAKRGDKNYPPVFVERTDIQDNNILKDIKSICDIVYEDFTRGEIFAAPTRIIHGAPGCGKSSLLMHVGKQSAWKNYENANTPDPLVLYLPGADSFMDLNSFGHMLRERLTHGQSHSLSTSQSTRTKVSGAIPTVIKGSCEVEHRTDYDDPVEAIVWDGLVNWNRPLIVAIDEFQTMDGYFDKKRNHASHPHVRVLRKLHYGSYKRPIMLALGGLCDVPDRLFHLGITRPDSDGIHAIGAFSPQETAELIES